MVVVQWKNYFKTIIFILLPSIILIHSCKRRTDTYQTQETDGFTKLPRFLNNGDGTIQDTISGLTWIDTPSCIGKSQKEQIEEIIASFNQDESHKYKDKIFSCQKSKSTIFEWRLPTIYEFETLFQAERPNFVEDLKASGFKKDLKSDYWTSETLQDSKNGWGFNISNGLIAQIPKYLLKKSTLSLWLVRGKENQYNKERFLVEDKIIKDNQLKITWLRNANVILKECSAIDKDNWGPKGLKGGEGSGALFYKNVEAFLKQVNSGTLKCGMLGLEEYQWRLPSRKELQSLLNVSSKDLFIPGAELNNTELAHYWTSDMVTYQGSQNKAWGISMADGRVIHLAKKSSHFVILVAD